jgi:putative DNA primase/helicase
MPKKPKTKEKCVNHPDRDSVFQGQCQECVEDFAQQGDQEFIDYLESIKAMDEAAKEKKKKREKIEGIDTFELIADDVQSNIDLWFSGIDDFYFYDTKTGLWKNGADVAVKAFLTHFRRKKMKMDPDTFSKMKITTLFKETIAILKGRLAKTIQSTPTPDKRYIPLGNGIFDLETEELIPYSKEFFFTTKIPWNYNPNAKCDQFSGMMNDWYTSEKAITGWEIMALCLYRGYPIHKFFILYSSGGQGKTTFFNILQTMLGRQNVSQVALDKLHNQFAAVDLHDKYANIADEAPPEKITNTEVLKQATGDSVISADRKHRSTISFKSYATMIFSLNQHDDRPPSTSDETDGFYRRFCMIEFKGSKAKRSPIKDLANLIAENTEEMEGILYNALKALTALKSRGWELSQNESVEETRRNHLNAANPLRKFIDEFCTRDPNQDITTAAFRSHLERYLDAMGRRHYSKKAIRTEFDNLGIDGDRVYDSVLGKRIPWWFSLQVNEDKLSEKIRELKSKNGVQQMNLKPLEAAQELKAEIKRALNVFTNATTEQLMQLTGAKDRDLVIELAEEVKANIGSADEINESTHGAPF